MTISGASLLRAWYIYPQNIYAKPFCLKLDMIHNNATDKIWDDQPDVIRKFLDLRPNHEKLCEEVTYIIKKLLQTNDLEYSAITWRAKKIDSFCDKLGRKKYEDPFKDVTDLAGVRIVYLYGSDKGTIESLIEREFKVLEKVDKIEEESPEQFGYGALHYLVHLGKKSSGARYDDLKDLVCEIQVRTILQDAWAIVAHHLSYKQESDVPVKLRRKLNALSGLFETADDRFIQLRDERVKYSEEVKDDISKDEAKSLNKKLNLDNLSAYLGWRFPGKETENKGTVELLPDLMEESQRCGYKTLADLNNMVARTEDAIKAYEKKYPPEPSGRYLPIGVVRVGMRFENEAWRKEFYSGSKLKQIEEFLKLVKPAPVVAKKKAKKRTRKPSKK